MFLWELSPCLMQRESLTRIDSGRSLMKTKPSCTHSHVRCLPLVWKAFFDKYRSSLLRPDVYSGNLRQWVQETGTFRSRGFQCDHLYLWLDSFREDIYHERWWGDHSRDHTSDTKGYIWRPIWETWLTFKVDSKPSLPPYYWQWKPPQDFLFPEG